MKYVIFSVIKEQIRVNQNSSRSYELRVDDSDVKIYSAESFDEAVGWLASRIVYNDKRTMSNVILRDWADLLDVINGELYYALGVLSIYTPCHFVDELSENYPEDLLRSTETDELMWTFRKAVSEQMKKAHLD